MNLPAIMTVLEFPPRLSLRRNVSTESRYGTNSFFLNECRFDVVVAFIEFSAIKKAPKRNCKIMKNVSESMLIKVMPGLEAVPLLRYPANRAFLSEKSFSVFEVVRVSSISRSRKQAADYAKY